MRLAARVLFVVVLLTVFGTCWGFSGWRKGQADAVATQQTALAADSAAMIVLVHNYENAELEVFVARDSSGHAWEHLGGHVNPNGKGVFVFPSSILGSTKAIRMAFAFPDGEVRGYGPLQRSGVVDIVNIIIGTPPTPREA